MNAIDLKIGLGVTGNKPLNQQKEGFHSLRRKRDAFKDILKSAPANGETKPPANQSGLIDKLQMFIGSWERLDKSIKERFRTLPKESRSLIELQYLGIFAQSLKSQEQCRFDQNQMVHSLAASP